MVAHRFRWVHLVRGLTLVAWCWGSSLPMTVGQDVKPGVRSDGEWLHKDATAFLVLEPPRLKGVSRWTIESPRHRGVIHQMAVSPDGTRAATGGVDGVIRIWNLENGSFEKAFVAHPYHIYTMAWSPDGRLLASHAWSDNRTRVWEVETGKQVLETKPIGNLRSLAFSPDSRRLAAGSDGSGRLYVTQGLSDYDVLTEIGKAIQLVAWTPDGDRLAVVAVGNQTTILEASGGRLAFTLDHPPDERALAIEWAPDGNTFATATAQAVTIWKSQDGTQVHRIEAKQPFHDVDWSPDGSRLLAVTAAGGEFFTAADGKPAGRHPVRGRIEWSRPTDRIVDLSPTRVDVWAPDGKSPIVSIDAAGTNAPLFEAGKPIVTGIGTPVLSTWDPKTLTRLHRLEGHTQAVMTAGWSKDGKHFASAGADGTVRIWDVAAGTQLHALTGHKGAANLVAWSPNGDVLASAGTDKTVRLWKADGSAGPVCEGHGSSVMAVAWSPNGKQFVSGGRDEKLIVWESASGEQVRSIDTLAGVTCIDWTAIKATPALACGTLDGGIRVFNATNGAEIAAVSPGHRGSYYTSSVAWMPGPQPRILAGRYYLTQIWDVGKADTVARQIAPGGATSVAPTAGGSLAVVRSGDRTVRFWEPTGSSLRGVLLEEGDSLVTILTNGDLKFDPESAPNLIAIVETETGQKTVSLEELKKDYGWKNNGKMLKLPTKD
jgi:WD40 repeat protein